MGAIYNVLTMPDLIRIGAETENGVERIAFDASEWLLTWPDMHLSVWAQEPKTDVMYEAQAHRDGAMIVWDVGAQDTRVSGYGAVLVMGETESGERKLSARARTYIRESGMNATADPPLAQQPWYTGAMAAAGQASADAGRAEAAAARAEAAEEAVYAPAASATRVDGGVLVTVTDKTGTTTAVIRDGERGETGPAGADGRDGADGKDGADGRDGYTPVKGVDYFDGADGRDGADGTDAVIDATLTQAGQAADAAKTGEAIGKLKNDVADIIPDDTVVSGKPWTSKKTVDSLCMPFEATGNPVQVYPVEGYPLGVRVSWEPVQAGSGDPSPDNIRPITGRDAVSVTRFGKNLINKNTAIVGDMVFGSDGTPANYEDVAVNYVKVKPNTLYTISYEYSATDRTMYCRIAFLNEKREFIARNRILGAESGRKITYSFTTSSETHWLQLGMNNIRDGFDHNYSMSLCEGDTACDYEPYADTTDIALPETVYGGTLDVETGVVTVTRGCIDSYAGEALPGKWISDRDVYESGESPTTGAQVVYEIAKPYTIKLDPVQIDALRGVNTVYTDAGTLTVTGREDPKHTITELRNAIISLGGNV